MSAPSHERVKREREIYRRTREGGVQLASGADRWVLHDDYVDLAPHHHKGGGHRIRVDAELLPFEDRTDRAALLIIDMQNDFCEPGGWTELAGLDPGRCRAAIPGIQRAVDAARDMGMFVVWLYWHNRPDLRNLGAPTLYSFKHKVDQPGIGEDSERGGILVRGTWGAEIVDDLKPYMREEDVHIEKYRMSGFWGTHLDQFLRTQGINTLYFSGVNSDQCVSGTLQDGYFRDYNCILLEDAVATSSPDFAQQGVIHNARFCWGFSTTTRKLADAERIG